MNRQYGAVSCFVLSLGLHVHLVMQGRLDPNWLLFPLVVGWGAFLLPVCLPVVMIERYVFRFEPYADGHTALTVWVMMLAAAAFWFLPSRIARLFGCFDAFKEGKRRRPVLVRGVADALDAVNKRLFGRQKTGGWA